MNKEQKMETINEYKETIDLFGKKREVTITIKTEFDNDYFHFMQDGTVGEYKDEELNHLILEIQEGNLSVDIIWVEVKCNLFSGTDCLGGYFAKLIDDDYTKDYLETVKNNDMVNEAIDDYRTNAKRYKDFFEA